MFYPARMGRFADQPFSTKHHLMLRSTHFEEKNDLFSLVKYAEKWH